MLPVRLPMQVGACLLFLALTSPGLHVEGRVLHQQTATVPTPAYYFPLTDNSLLSAEPAGEYVAVPSSTGLSWTTDPTFGTVIDCDATQGTFVTLPRVLYGQNGPFAVSFWAKVRDNSGGDLNYIFSHIGPAGASLENASSEVHIYLPELAHPHTGVVRTIVRDASDPPEGATPTFLDSDGCVSDPQCRGNDAAGADPTDGGWHQIVVTTSVAGGKGFELYVDGELAGDILEGVQYTDTSGGTHSATGGRPMDLGGDVHLCSRVDESPSRFFSGSVAHLRIYNEALSAADVKSLFDDDARNAALRAAASGAVAALPPAAESAASTAVENPDCATPCSNFNGVFSCTNRQGQLITCGSSSQQQPASATTSATKVAQQGITDEGPCDSPCTEYNGELACLTATGNLRSCTLLSTTTPAPQSSRTVGEATAPTETGPVREGSAAAASIDVVRINGQPLCSERPITGLETAAECGEGYLCVPLTREQLEASLGAEAVADLAETDIVGVCAFSPDDILLPDPSIVPPASAFFPLTSRSVESFPLGEYKALSVGAGTVEDPLFGRALRCRSTDQDLVAIDPVAYGTAGAFAINLWARPVDLSGDSFDYLFSHRSTIQSGDLSVGQHGFGPNQIQLLLPQEGHPSHGIARTFVRDGNDIYQGPESEAYLDSDGQISNNGGRPGPFPLLDGNWHMFTITSQPDGGPGYVFYIDGALAGGMNATIPPVSADSIRFHVDGGDPMQLDGDIVLCSRSYDYSERHFDGTLAYLSIWNQSLSPEQVAALHDEVAARAATLPPDAFDTIGAETAAISTRRPGDAVQRTSIDGDDCQFPVLYNGQLRDDCIFIGELPMCQVARNEWEECDLTETEWEELAAAQGVNLTTLVLTQPDSGGGDAVGEQGGVSSPIGLSTRAPMFSADGRLCRLPLTFSGISVDNCVGIEGEHFCWTEDRFGSSSGGEASSSTVTVGGPFSTGRNTPALGTWAPCATNATMLDPEAGQFGVGASAVPVLSIRRRTRFTEAGELCQLPRVVDGAIIDDCIEREGLGWACLTASGDWRTCDLPRSEMEEALGSGGQLHVTQRQTVDGETCTLPAVYGGYLHFDCVPYGAVESPDGVQKICPSASGAWKACAPFEGDIETKALNLEDALARSQPGTQGQLCILEPSLASAAQNCADGLTCIPLPQFQPTTTNATSPQDGSSVPFMPSNLSGVAPLLGAGFCTPRPAGTTFGVFNFLAAAGAAQPLAYFPLTGGDLSSATIPEVDGEALGDAVLVWQPDPQFEMVPVCRRAEHDAVRLSNLAYGVDGNFAINLWMRRNSDSDLSGDTFQYLYHHSGIAAAPGYSPNQIAIYVTDRDHPAYPAVRAMVKDSDDHFAEITWLDSDGRINSNANRSADITIGDTEDNPVASMINVNDGAWHMITLSTLVNDSPGFALYVDGGLSGVLHQNLQLNNGSLAVPTGGDPALMEDDIILCARSDLSHAEDRFYDGALTNLMIFDAAVTADQVKTLYSAYNPEAYSQAVLDASGGAPSGTAVQGTSVNEESGSESGGSSGMDAGLIVGIVFGVIGGTAALVALAVFAASALRNRRAMRRFERFADTGQAWYGNGGGPGDGNGGPGTHEAAVAAAGGPLGPTDGTLTIQLSNGGSGKLKDGSRMSSMTTKSGELGVSPRAQSGVEYARSPGSIASHSTMTDDVEIESGKRSLFGKKSAKVLIPEDLAP